jgi:3-oxoacyl-[acyl-carrier protein] reductase
MMGNAGQVPYAAAKAGCVGLTRALAKEWGSFKINVNAIAFGFIDTRMTSAKGSGEEFKDSHRSVELGIPEQARAMAEALIPLGRTAAPEEAARGVYFLCSPLSDYVHGQVLNVSGGIQMGMGT